MLVGMRVGVIWGGRLRFGIGGFEMTGGVTLNDLDVCICGVMVI